ncbi:effector-associated constant component EACC1 [Streptomyces griseoviridis]|uniref:effector-associated constant component EACC1 n=1 Tax=Streptomyces griseoviridis TaxID=45398 RepID=UPI002646885F|nr:hypothetical protein [Streptomyces griseoviridis]
MTNSSVLCAHGSATTTRSADRRNCADAPSPKVTWGGGLDVLVVALGSGGAATLLVQSVSTWLNQRRSDVTVTIRATDGREVSISVTRASDPLAVMREAERLVPLQPHE